MDGFPKISENKSHAAERPQAVSSWRMAMARRSELLTWPAEILLRLAVVVREAVPVGLLRQHEIEHVVRQAYREFPDFYDPDSYPLRYESELLPLLERHAIGQRLLDLFCGQGREAEIFAAAGFEVLGVDEDAGSIEKARAYCERSGADAEFVVADVDHWQPAENNLDVIYSSLWMYSCIPDRSARVRWLERVSAWLGRDGLLVISVTPRRSLRAARLRNFIAGAVALASLNGRRPELGDRFHTRLFWHDFTNVEVEAELVQAGLRVLDTLEIGGFTACTFFIATRDTGGVQCAATTTPTGQTGDV